MEEQRRDPSLFVAGVIITVVVHALVLGAMLLSRAHGTEHPKGVGTFVDAQLVRFGKPRDLKFLPHKDGVVHRNVKPDAIKIAKDDKALPRLDEKKPDEKYDPLKKTHADLFKNVKDDDQPEAVEEQTGSLTGSRAGTATEARGDPYILALIDAIGSQWRVPSTIKDAELANLSARVCLDISNDGTLRGYQFREHSKNTQFDSSLDAALSTIKKVPAPPAKWQGQTLCPVFVKQ